ncbi:MAG: Na(+)-translocating NADH-quinone reductase subunit C [Halieaceae bacterium]|nr:Na(+)-translocating NADH-quinone reductase subunit C [Halieaceae bacterium]
MPSKDTVGKTLGVALALCIACSVVVSTAAVMLKPAQEANVALDRKRNILAAAGMLEEGRSIDEQFESISTLVVDMRSGRFSEEVDGENYNSIAAAKDPDQSSRLEGGADSANIGGRRENFGVVYVVGDRNAPDTIILPVRGAGLWGQMYGFLALEEDLNTVAGLGFYEHKETPGLGGEVDNPRWKALWPGKNAFRDGAVAIEVIKGTANREGPMAAYQVDGLSGATLTTRGVNNLVQFWLGDDGFGPFLSNLKAGEA